MHRASRRDKGFPLPQEGRSLRTGSAINGEGEKTIGQTLIDNLDLFAWIVADIPRLHPRVVSHCLSVFKGRRGESWLKKGDKPRRLKPKSC